MQNNIGCIHFVVVSLQVSVCSFIIYLYEWCELLWIFIGFFLYIY